jgi:hypothetical protein
MIQIPKLEPRIMRYELTDYEWAAIRPMLPNKARGVPRVDDRRVHNGICWVLRSGAPWRDLPDRYGPRTTCYNRFVRWRRAGVWELIRVGEHLVGINTGHPNQLAVEAVVAGRIPSSGATRPSARGRIWPREPRRPVAGSARTPYLLCRSEERHAASGTTGGVLGLRYQARVEALGGACRDGPRRASGGDALCRAAQRLRGFRIAADIDSAYDAAFQEPRAAGVEALCYYCRVDPVGIEIEAPLAIAVRAWKA